MTATEATTAPQAPPVLRPEFDRPFRVVRVAPTTIQDARAMQRELRQDIARIGADLADPGRRTRMSAQDHGTWHGSALHAQQIKKNQLAELSLWVRARTTDDNAPGRDPAERERQAALRAAHNRDRRATLLDQAARAGLDPQDPAALLRELHAIIVEALKDDVAFEADELAVLSLAGDYLRDRGRQVAPPPR